MKTVTIIPAAGAGLRMGADRPKQFMNIDNKPLLAVTLEKFQKCRVIDGIILVVPESDVAFCEEKIVAPYQLSKVKKIIAGGEKRQDSVRLGLESTKGEFDLTLIHDGVRPFVSPYLIEQIVNAAHEYRAVTAAIPVKDTIKGVDKNGFVTSTYERQLLWQVQTPQAFRYEDIKSAHCRAAEEDWGGVTDDAFLMEKVGIPVKVVEGSETNIKITTKFDIEFAKFLLNRDIQL